MAIQEAPEPKNTSELKAYLGLLNYYGKFLPNLSTILYPLYRLLNATARWSWNKAKREAFKASKKLLTSSTVLTHYNPSQELALACDASPAGVGAVPSHRFVDGSEKPLVMLQECYQLFLELKDSIGIYLDTISCCAQTTSLC